HRNLMSEFMGLIHGVYDAKPQGFVPGGISLHNCMLPHGPDETAFEHASNSELKPVKLTDTMAFMFETRFPQRLTKYAADLKERQDAYMACGKGSRRPLDPGTETPGAHAARGYAAVLQGKRSSHDRRDPFTPAAQLGRLGPSARRLSDPEPAALRVHPAGRRRPRRRRDRGRHLRSRRGARTRLVRWGGGTRRPGRPQH